MVLKAYGQLCTLTVALTDNCKCVLRKNALPNAFNTLDDEIAIILIFFTEQAV